MTEGSVLKGIKRHHKITKSIKNGQFDASVFVYRDPAERVVSAFVNKLVQQAGAVDFTRSVEDVMGANAGDITFKDFVDRYVSFGSSRRIDAHVVSQVNHLIDVEYTHPIRLDRLRAEMSGLIGEELAYKYFSRKGNSSGDRTCQFGEAWNKTVYDLRECYQKKGVLPSKESFFSQEILTRLNDVYRDDYRLLPRQ